MNARSKYLKVGQYEATDCRGNTRVIVCKTGVNKGKRYPYASKRQKDRPVLTVWRRVLKAQERALHA